MEAKAGTSGVHGCFKAPSPVSKDRSVLHPINKEFLDGLALVIPIALVVPLGGGKLNWTMLAAILACVTIARSVQAGVTLPEQVFPVLCGALIVPCVLLEISRSKGRAARGKFRGDME
ncbi:hypothetical protein WDV90_15760 [Xanthomonas translucens pv. undulosa]|uniref:hypothetical protein n=1 Tax=Xanthomonas campestris pv. translucens TaxID=343 RepID=UPI001F510C01|nr:hypothetical protein [Xanthomonas translucens]WLA04079.1 hypothetical protein MO329_15875 [Xanthomonas translucens]